VLDYLPKSLQPKAALHEIWIAVAKAQALVAFAQFVTTFEAKYPKAVECLVKDREALLAFYDFPAEHWIHIRTTNPIESTFATIRHRTDHTKGYLTRDGMLSMIFKLGMSAERNWYRLRKVSQSYFDAILPYNRRIFGAGFDLAQFPGRG
jgi:transposase-like protein